MGLLACRRALPIDMRLSGAQRRAVEVAFILDLQKRRSGFLREMFEKRGASSSRLRCVIA